MSRSRTPMERPDEHASSERFYTFKALRLAHIPNILTLLRIAASPILILLLKNDQYSAALWLCALAGISDALDGYLAKTFGCETRIGAILDPIADKVLITSVVVMLALNGVLPFWLLLVIVFRDLLIVGGWMLLTMLNMEVTMRPSLISKSNTMFQILLLLGLIIEQAGALPIPEPVILTLMTIVVLTTVLSGLHYVWIWGFTDAATPVAANREDGDAVIFTAAHSRSGPEQYKNQAHTATDLSIVKNWSKAERLARSDRS